MQTPTAAAPAPRLPSATLRAMQPRPRPTAPVVRQYLCRESRQCPGYMLHPAELYDGRVATRPYWSPTLFTDGTCGTRASGIWNEFYSAGRLC